jgi:hypothetical protein
MSREIFKLHGVIEASGLQQVLTGLEAIDKQFAKADKALTKFARQSAKIGTELSKYFTAPIVALGASMVMLGDKTADYARKLQKMETITGLSAQTLQEFQHVAKLTDTNFDGLVGSITKLTKKMAGIVEEGGTPYKTIERLGVSVKDSSGHIRDMNVLFPELIKKLQLVENPIQRNQMSMEIFGKSISDLAPVLALTGNQLDAMRKEAHDMGLVMGGEALKEAADYGIEVIKLKERFDAFIRDLGSKFIPILRDDLLPIIQTRIIPAIQGFADKIKWIIEWFKNLDSSTKKLIVGIIGFTAVLGPAILILGKTILVIKSLTVAANLMKVAFLTNPFGAALLGATALAAILFKLNNEVDKLNKEREENYSNKMKNLLDQDTKHLNRLEEIQKQGTWSYIDPDELKRLGVADGKLENIGARIATLKKLTDMVKGNLDITTPKTSTIAPMPLNPGDNKSNEVDAAEKIEAEMSDIDKKAQERRIRNIQLKYDGYEKEIAMANEEEDKKKKIQVESLKAQESELQKEEDAANTYANNMVGIYTGLGQEIGAAIAMGIGDGQKGLKESFKAILKIFVDFLEKTLIAAIMGNALKSFLVGGGIPGLIKAAAESALIVGMFEVAKKGIESFASGSFVEGGHGGVVAQIGEGRQDEIVMPLKTGIQALADGIISRMNEFMGARPTLAFAGAGGRSYTFQIGTLIADDRGIKELQRRLSQFEISEGQRKGAD